MKRLTIAPLAQEDLNEIADYIGGDSPDCAITFVQELEGRARAAAERPLSFRARSDLGENVRSIVHGRYLILFRDLPEQVVVLRFWHSAQDPGDLTLA